MQSKDYEMKEIFKKLYETYKQQIDSIPLWNLVNSHITNPEKLMELLSNEIYKDKIDSDILFDIAKNTNATPEILRKLLGETSKDKINSDIVHAIIAGDPNSVNPEFFQKALKEQAQSRLIAASSLPPILDRLDSVQKRTEELRNNQLPPVKTDKLQKQKLPKASLPESLTLQSSRFINPRSWAKPIETTTGESLPPIDDPKKRTPKNFKF